jgi:hypothetical protein
MHLLDGKLFQSREWNESEATEVAIIVPMD